MYNLVCVLRRFVHIKMYYAFKWFLFFNGFYLFFLYICRCLSKLLLSGQRTSATFIPFVTISTPQTRSPFDITATFIAVWWARNRTVLTITSLCVTSSNVKKWILRENYYFFFWITKWTFPVTLFYISRKHENQFEK